MTGPSERASRVLYILIAISIPLVTCGHRLPPPGGPEDKEPPVLIETIPGPEETGVDLSTKIQILFDENVDEESAVRAVLLSPVHEKVKLKVKGKRVELWPEDGLFPSTTYQVTVGRNLLDRRGNGFMGPVTFYFSTGDSLDTGIIRGNVRYRGKPAKGAFVIANTLPDSISYHVQADTSGKYRMAHLPMTRFSVRAFLDQNGDGKYRYAVEPIDEKETEVSDELVVVDFDLMVQDTSPPVLQSVEPVDSITLKLIFDDPMRFETVRKSPEGFSLFPEKDSTTVIPLVSAERDSADAKIIVLETKIPLDDGQRYWIELTGIVNESGLYGRPLSNRKKFTFYGK
ncbi:MAG: Ig-like domain-containing protein [Candidatus Glassbacteria bacterium]